MEELKNEQQASKKKKHKNDHKNDSERTRKSAIRLTTGQKKQPYRPNQNLDPYG